MSEVLTQLIVLVVLAIVGMVVMQWSGGRVTPERLSQAAQMAAMAAEQYKSTGQLKSGDEQLEFAIQFVKQLLPATKSLPDSVIIDAIHAFVPAANAITAQITAAAPTTFNIVTTSNGDAK